MPSSSHAAPRPGVTEIRVHGVGGATPQQLLGQSGVHQVTGDVTAGLYRGAVGPGMRTVEAYSWGGLTAGDRNRAFWVLLLPFSMINLAGWMVEPARDGDPDPTPAIRWHEGLVLWIGLVTTAAYVLWVAFVSVDLAAVQCGAVRECVAGRWYLSFLQDGFFSDRVGRRMVAGLLPPLGLLALFVWLGSLSRSRYDEYGDPAAVDGPGRPSSPLNLPQFWFTAPWQAQAARLHVAGVVALLAAVLVRAASRLPADLGVAAPGLRVGSWLEVGSRTVEVAVLAAAVVVVAGTLVVLAAMAAGYRTLVGQGMRLDGLTRTLWWAAALLLAAAVAVTWQVEVPDVRLAPRGVGGVRAAAAAVWGFGWMPVLLLSLAILLVGAFSLLQVGRWIARPRLYVDQFLVALMLLLLILWEWAVATGALTLVGLAAVWAAAAWLRRRGGTAPQVVGAPATAATVLAAVALRAAGGSWPAPWGGGARLGPLLLFAGVLAGLTAWRADGRRLPGYLAAVAGAVLGAGAAAAAWTGASEWLHLAGGLVFAVLALVWLAGFEDPGYRGFRWNGPAAVALFGLALIAGAFSGGVIRLVDLLDGDGTAFVLRSTAIYEWVTLGFAAAAVAGAVGVLVWSGAVGVGRWSADYQAEARRLRGLGGAAAATARRVASRQVLAEALRCVDAFITVVAMLMLAGWIALALHLAGQHGAAFRRWIDQGTPGAWAAGVDAASWLAVAVVAGAVLAVRRGLRDPSFRTQIGILWDVASFWPRTFHPFAPPAYAARAVPELQARMAEVAAVRAAGQVILSGHSQGSVISLAAVASLPEDARRHVWLVTHGSPLGRFYHAFFPRYFTPDLFAAVDGSLGGGRGMRCGGWINFYRPTDPIADPVLAAEATGGGAEPPRPTVAGVLAAGAEAGSCTVALPDVRLHDPWEAQARPGQPAPAPRGHGDYLADPMMAGVLDALTADLQRPAPHGRPPGAGGR